MIAGSLEVEMLANMARLRRDMGETRAVVSDAMTSVDRSVAKAKTSIDNFTNALKGIALGAAAREALQMVDAYTKYTAQLKLATTSNAEYAAARERVRTIAATANSELASTGTLYARITTATRELGLAQKSVGDISEVVALSLKVSGAGASEQASAILQLSQAFGSGVLRGQEFNAVNEAAPRLMKALADGIGQPVGKLRELAEAGKLTTDVMAVALPRALRDLRNEAKSIETISGAWTVLKNNVMEFVGETAQSSGTVKVLTGLIRGLSDNIDTLVAVGMGWIAMKLSASILTTAAAVVQQTSAIGAQVAAQTASNAAAVAATGAEVARTTAVLGAVSASRAEALAELARSNALIIAEKATIAAATAAGAQSFALAALRTATVSLTVAEGQRSVALAALAGLGVQQASASAASTAAITANAAAVGAASIAMRAKTATAGALSSTMKMLGGPIGLITTLLGLGVTAWSLWGTSSANAANQAKGAMATSTEEILGNLNLQIQKLKERNELVNQGKVSVAQAETPAAVRLGEINTQLNELRANKTMDNFSKQMKMIGLEDEAKKLASGLKEVDTQQKNIKATSTAALTETFLDKYGDKARKLQKELKEAKEAFGGMIPPEVEAAIRKQFEEPVKGAVAAFNDGADAQLEAVRRLSAQSEFMTKRAVSAITAARAAGSITEMEAINQTAAAETASYGVKIANLQKEMNIQAQKKNSQKEVAEVQSQIDMARLEQQNVIIQRDTEIAAVQRRMGEESVALSNRAIEQAWTEANALAEKNKKTAEDNELIGLSVEKAYAITDARAASNITRQEELIASLAFMDQTKESLELMEAERAKLAEMNKERANSAVAFDKNAAKEIEDFLDPTKAKSFGDALKDSFGEAGNGLAQMANALQDYTQKQAALNKMREKASAMSDADPKKIKLISDLNDRATKEQIGAYADMAGAAKNFFEKGSKGYKTLQAAENAFRVFEMAMAVKSMVQQLFTTQAITTAKTTSIATETAAVVASVPVEVAANTTKAASSGIAALASSLVGVFPLTLGQFAAVAGMLAAIGVGVSGASSAGSASAEPDRDISADIQKAQGTGTILGDEGAKSESIKNSLELLAENSAIGLDFTQRMLSGINRTADNITQFVATIAKMQGLRGTAADEARWGIGGDKTLVDSGLGFLPEQTIKSIIEQGIQGFGYGTTYFREKGGEGTAGINKSDFGDEFTDQFGGIISSMIDSVQGAASALGMNNAGLIDRIMAVMPSIGDTTDVQRITGKMGGGLLSLKGLAGDEISDELNAVFSSIGDQIAMAALPELKSFQHVGEGYLETLVRVSSGIEVAGATLEQFGITAIDYRDIVRKAGETSTEIVRQSITNIETAADGGLNGVGRIVDEFVGTVADLAGLYTTLNEIRGLMKSVGTDATQLNSVMVRGAGGLDQLQSGLDSYFESFFTDEEKLAASQARLAEQFAIVGVSVPSSVEAFRDLVDGIDLSTEGGQRFYGQLMNLTQSFADVQEMAEDLADVQTTTVDAQLAAAEKLKESWLSLLQTFDGVANEFLSPEVAKQYKAERIQMKLGDAGLGFTTEQILGASTQDFKDFFLALDKTTLAGQDQAKAMLAVWAMFKEIKPEEVTTDAAKVAEAARKSALDAAEAAYKILQESVARQKTVLKDAFDAQTEQMEAAYQALQESTARQKDVLKDAFDKASAQMEAAGKAQVEAAQDRLSAIQRIFSALDSAIGSTMVESAELDLARRKAAQGLLQTAAAGARRGANVAGYAGLEDALKNVAEPSEELYATFEEYAFAQATTAQDIFTLRNAASAQVSVAESTLNAIQAANEANKNALKAKYDADERALDEQLAAMKAANEANLKALKDQYDADVAALDETLAIYRAQIDAIKNGAETTTFSIVQAVAKVEAAILGIPKALEAPVTAVDGSHAMGLAQVPFDGYVAELHEGERVLTKQDNQIFSQGGWMQSQGGGGDSEAAAEVRNLRDVVGLLLTRIGENTGKAADAASRTADQDYVRVSLVDQNGDAA